jgi:integrase
VPRVKASAPRRRTRGEGTLYEKVRTWKTSDGKTHSKKMWVAAISEGYVAERGRPRRRRRFFYGKTAEEARTARNRYLNQVGKDLPTEQNETATVSQYADRFVEHAKENARAATAYTYERTLRLHVTPYIGKVSLTDLSPDRIKALYDTLKGKVSSSMLARVHVVLRAMLNLAREERVIVASPLESIRKAAPRHTRPRIEGLTKIQAKALLKAAKGHRLEALFIIALTTGMRQGELFALRWSDVDLQHRTLYVQRSAQEVSGEISFVEPKTALSRRRVALSAIAIEALKRRRRIADREDHESPLVFPSDRGHVLRKSNFLRKDWEPIRTAAELPGTRFHDLRHTAASLLLIEGVHPKVVSEMLGHASIRLTLDTYSHLIPTMQAGAADAFDRVLGRQRRAPKAAKTGT